MLNWAFRDVTDAADVADVAHVADVADVADVAAVADVADVADVAHVADVGVVADLAMRRNNMCVYIRFEENNVAHCVFFFQNIRKHTMVSSMRRPRSARKLYVFCLHSF